VYVYCTLHILIASDYVIAHPFRSPYSVAFSVAERPCARAAAGLGSTSAGMNQATISQWPALYDPVHELYNIQRQPPIQPAGRYLHAPYGAHRALARALATHRD
jgi:hypothetical protein